METEILYNILYYIPCPFDQYLWDECKFDYIILRIFWHTTGLKTYLMDKPGLRGGEQKNTDISKYHLFLNSWRAKEKKVKFNFL